MKKRSFSRWLLTALAAMTVFSAPAAKKTFTAVTSNVDGLPPVVHIDYTIGSKDVNMNADGSQEPGATRMGQLFAENLWDIIALSEDFNYHSYIMNGVSTYYNAGKWRGLVDQSNLNGNLLNYPQITVTNNKGLYMKTDGLGFLTRKKYKVTPGVDQEGEGKNWVRWNGYYGVTDHEADGLIAKGFRFYQVTLAEGLVVDVYITHMEAGSDPGDNEERAKQLTQFATYIREHKGTNPIIILGDTNCRYTRDPIYENFIKEIEKDTQLHVKDPWVEIIRDGEYPEPNSPSIMVSQYGEQRGEVVDKIFYINNDNSKSTLTCKGYLHDDSFTYADGSQIADHYPVVGTFEIENPDAPTETVGVEIPDAPAKSGVVSGTTYYLRNLGSGEFIRAGGAWTTQAVMGDYPSKFKLTSKGGDKWTLQSTHDNKWLRFDGNNYFVDQAENQWTLTQVDKNIYTLADADGNAVGFKDGVVAVVSSNTSDKNQQWEFLTQADLINELYYATSDAPKDVTFLMKAPDFGYADQESWTNSKGNNASHGKQRPTGYEHVSFWKAWNDGASGIFGNSNGRNWNLSQTVSGLPAGTYEVTYQVAAYNLGDNHGFKINGETAEYTNLGTSDPGNATVAKNLAAGQYSHKVTVTVPKDGTYGGKIEIKVAKEATKSATGAYYDNFKIKCIGVEGAIDMSVYDRVEVAINDAKAKANEAHLDKYKNYQVETLWEERGIVGDGWKEVKQTYKNLAEAVLQVKDIPADYTYALVNPSFELYPNYKDSRYNIGGGFPLGWSYTTHYAYDSGVWPASNNDKLVNNPDGEYIFNTWDNGNGGNAVYQEVTLTPGIYKLSAKVASSNGNKVYLYAGSRNNSVTTIGNSDLVPIELNFSVADGKPFELGVAGATSNGSFTKEGGVWYKADDFHLTRIGGAETIKGMEMLQLAINQATERAKALNGYDTAFANNMAKYQAMIDNYTLVGDGKEEFEEVYDLLRAIIYALPTTDASGKAKEVDYTYAIANNSFEWNNTYGWDLKSSSGDTGVKPNSDTGYKISGCDGSYLFNTWQDGNGTAISQKINNLPAGHYSLDAVFANDPNDYVFLEVIGQEGVSSQREIFQLADDKDKGATKQLQFDVAEGTPSITIVAGGCNSDGSYNDLGGRWYKVDNFRLTRMGDAKICFFYKRLRDAIDEANSVASELPKKYSEQWDAQDYQDLIDKHLADGHDPDKGETSEKYDPLNGGSGIEEINTLFQRLRDLIFSQTETGADMSGAITNNSFELGDLTGWTTYMETGADAQVTVGTNGGRYGTEGTDGTYLYNAYYSNDRLAHPIYQVIPNVPAGRYTLTVKIASDPGAKFFLGANDKHSDIINITEDLGKFADFSFTFEVPVEAESKDVKIGVYPTGVSLAKEIGEAQFADDAVGPWYKVDHFRLKLESRYLDIAWTPETENTGTIMLPFALDKDEYNEYLGKHGFKAHYIDQLEKNETPADIERNLYRIIKLSEPLDELEANKPYLLVKDAAQPAAVKSIKAADASEENVYHIYGWSTNVEDLGDGEKKILLGSLTDYSPNYLHYHLQTDELGNVGFVLHDPNDPNGESGQLDQYHACIKTALTPEGFAETDNLVMHNFYFEEPVQLWEVELEEGRYGTIILPFEAEIPAGLVAVEMTGVSELRNALTHSYQIAELSEPATKLEAHVPYLVRSNDASKTVFTFEGVAENDVEEFSPEGNLLTGLFKSRDGVYYNENKKRDLLEAGHWVLTSDDDNRPIFIKTTEETELPAYSAYICNPAVQAVVAKMAARPHLLAEGEEEAATNAATPEADVIYLNADHAKNTVEWTMETADYGTIILPFEAEIPEGLEAYEVSAPAENSEVEDMPTMADKGKSYQLLQKVEATTLEANKTYLMMKKAPAVEEPGTEEIAPLSIKAAGSDVYTFTGTPDANLNPEATGVIQGTYAEKNVVAGDYLLNDEGKGFEKLASEASVDAHHGYISKDSLPEAPDYLVLAEPEPDQETGVDAIMAGEENVDIFTLQGVCVARDVNAAETLRTLEPGIYVLRAGNRTVKVIK